MRTVLTELSDGGLLPWRRGSPLAAGVLLDPWAMPLQPNAPTLQLPHQLLSEGKTHIVFVELLPKQYVFLVSQRVLAVFPCFPILRQCFRFLISKAIEI